MVAMVARTPTAEISTLVGISLWGGGGGGRGGGGGGRKEESELGSKNPTWTH